MVAGRVGERVGLKAVGFHQLVWAPFRTARVCFVHVSAWVFLDRLSDSFVFAAIRHRDTESDLCVLASVL